MNCLNSMITVRNAHVRNVFRGIFGAWSEQAQIPLLHQIPLNAHEFKTKQFQTTQSTYTKHSCIGVHVIHVECWTSTKEMKGTCTGTSIGRHHTINSDGWFESLWKRIRTTVFHFSMHLDFMRIERGEHICTARQANFWIWFSHRR